MRLYSNEIVFRGHPDKTCDQISDAILDAYLVKDKGARCGIEVMGGKGKLFITGEVTAKAEVEVAAIARRVLKEIGYDDQLEIVNNLGVQSNDIALGTNETVGGAGDQGMMFGFACDDTPEYKPTAMVMLQRLSRFYDELRQKDERFLPDGKTQITGYYDDEMKLKKIKTWTISYQNTERERAETDQILIDFCRKLAEEYGLLVEEFLINPTGKFLIGGFEGDAGLTGRKIVVDSYQSFAPVGGGAFSGKDPSKVDRSGAYKAREIAVEYLKKYRLKRCEVQLSYAIGVARPLAIYIIGDGKNIEPEPELYEACTPRRMTEDLGLLEKKYEETAKFGHF
ncbi:MAG: methionine adenosyltransferase domain-containing protein [Candidatus Saccharibacteria bacterium]|nr:methionine adenosyltransferase domain-containing protein [Candidatus Saccharibacteria bacterium]